MQKKHSSLLAVIFYFIFISLTLFTIGASYWIWLETKDDRVVDLQNNISLLKGYYELTFEQRETGLLSVGRGLQTITGENKYERQRAYMHEALKTYDEFFAFGFADTLGNIPVFSTQSNSEEVPNLMENPYTKRSFIKAKKSFGLAVGEVYHYRPLADWILPIRVPIHDSLGVLVGLNTSAIPYESLIRELKDFQLNPRYHIHLIHGDFGSTQLYHPLEEDMYDSVLHQAANIYEDRITTAQNGGMAQFTGTNRLTGKRCIGVQTSLSSLNHELIVSVDYGILLDEFWSDFRFILMSFLVLLGFLGLAFRSSVKKEDTYVSQIQAERDYSNKVIDVTPSLIVGINQLGQCTFLNVAAEKLTGYDRSEIIGKKWFTQLAPHLSDQDISIAKTRIRSSPGAFIEMELTTKNQDRRTVAWRSVTHYSKGDDLIEYVWFGNDVSEQKEFEKKLRHRDANLKALFESTNSIIGLFDKNKRLVEFNHSFALYAKATDEIDLYEGMDVFGSMKNQEVANIFSGFHDRALAGEKFKETLEYPSGDGGSIYFLFNYNPIYADGEIVGSSMFVEDITELRKSQQELEKYTRNLEGLVGERTQKLEEANDQLKVTNNALERTIQNLKQAQNQLIQSEKMASLGVLSAGIGHEINNPLNFIKNGIHALKKEIKDANEDGHNLKAYFEIVEEGVNRASNIVKSLSHFSHQGSTQMEICDVNDILDNCLTILSSKLKHTVEVTRDYTKNAATLKGNEGKLHQAFLNLLANAQQAIEVEGTIIITTLAAEKLVSVSIKDSGVGITEENLNKIGDPFFTTKPPGTGTGLGLSITYSIIEEHKGLIEVNSEVNEGTEFVVTLPRNL
ncbi:MAG: ATP-binding protein [Bacteroidota bacterium]